MTQRKLGNSDGFGRIFILVLRAIIDAERSLDRWGL